jgi:hypothetical protein
LGSDKSSGRTALALFYFNSWVRIDLITNQKQGKRPMNLCEEATFIYEQCIDVCGG